MNIKKITAFAADFVLSIGVLAAVPEVTEDYDGSVVVASADDEDFECHTYSVKIENGRYVKKKGIAGYNGKGGDIRIPDGVEYISDEAFWYNKTITSVTFPKSCTLVGTSAFNGCKKLKKVTFEGDADIGDFAFNETAIKSITIKGNAKIGRSIYGGYKSDKYPYDDIYTLENIVIGGNAEIGEAGFGSVRSLKKVTIKGDCKIGEDAFIGCWSLKNVTINGAIIDEVGVSAFEYCTSLRMIKLPENENGFRIREFAFKDCWSLSSINIPSKCKSIEYAAFRNCFSLKELTIPEKTELDEGSVGYSRLYAKKEQAGDKVTDGIEMLNFIGDGKKFGYDWNGKTQKIIKATPARLTLTVTKGSPAEKYAKENGIKYKYAK